MEKMRTTKINKGPVFVLFLLLLVGGYWLAMRYEIIPQAQKVAPSVPPVANLPNDPIPQPKQTTTLTTPVAPVPISTKTTSATNNIVGEILAWNAQSGLLLANGGTQTVSGSLMHRHGVNLTLRRNDDVPQMQANMVKFAQDFCVNNSPNPSGIHFVIIMGDGAPSFLAGLNPQLAKFGQDCIAEIIGAVGFSHGEDKFMGPIAWKLDPQTARGGLAAAYLRDGDWNIAMKWLADNGICNNPNEKTEDPNCLNCVPADSYIDAAQKYVSKYCETRSIVNAGVPMLQSKEVCVQAVATWTPGDVTVAKKKGGLVSIVSTKEYRWQMPAVVIANKRWVATHEDMMAEMLAAAFEGGELVKTNSAVLRKAAEISAEVYKEETAEYWEKYFKGVTEKDAQGLNVELGGSRVNNLADNLHLFGLESGGNNIFSAVYNVFGNILVQQYPDLVPSYPPVEEILNLRILQKIAAKTTPNVSADLPEFTPVTGVKQIVARKSWSIGFEFGKAALTKEGERTLEELFDQVSVTSLVIEVHGHTDNIGKKAKNQQLSEERAFAVKSYLQQLSISNFPDARFARVAGHGDENPVAPNTTEAGRAKNRRVDIVLGTAS